MEYVELSNGIKISKMVLGSFNVNDQTVLTNMVKEAINQGVNAFDTAPSYGSEELLGKALKNLGGDVKRDSVVISDKIDGWQMQRKDGDIESFVDSSLTKLQTDYIDILLVHWPFYKYLQKTWRCMEKLYQKGKVRAIGLCNVNERVLREFQNKGIEIKPHLVQNEISPFWTDENSTKFFENQNILVEAYSPMCRMIPEIRSNEILNELGRKYSKSVAQIILRWHVDKGIVPVFTSSKPERIVQNTDIWDFALSKEDVDRITALNKNYKIFPESFGCPGY